MWYDNVEFFDESNPKILEYAKSIIAVCDDWIVGHFNKERYVECWMADIDRFLVPIGFGDEFDLKPIMVRELAKTVKLVECKECGITDDYTCYHRSRKLPLWERIEYLSDCYENPNDFPDDCLRIALEQCFTAYRKNIGPRIGSVQRDIRQLRRDLKRKKPTLSLLLWANHVRHSGGFLLDDYGGVGNINYSVVAKISNEGLESVFSIEELNSIKP
jgi:hypothetical protein